MAEEANIWTEIYQNILQSSFLAISVLISVCTIIVTSYLIRRCSKTKEEMTTRSKEPQNHQKEMPPKESQSDEEMDKNRDSEEDQEAWDSSGGLVGQLKTARLKKIEETLTEEQIKSEREIEREQLAAIFELLRQQEEQHNLGVMGEDDFKAQLSLYR